MRIEDMRTELIKYKHVWDSMEKKMYVKCLKKTSVFFLKVHKCGSSTVQNILMRFGRHHQLYFVLPEINNYVGNPSHFSPELIGQNVRLPDGEKYDIFAHHTRYSHKEVRSIMKKEAPFVAIMREPTALQVSMYSYYQMEHFYGVSLPKFLQLNLTYLEQAPRFWERVGRNQIAWDLGVTDAEMKMPYIFEKLANKVENEFDLVMITEFMEASLVLFADLMCWPLEEVRFIRLNALREVDNSNFKKPVLTEEEMSMLKKLNNLDIQLYSHFKERFKRRILDYGAERMISEVNQLIDMNSQLYNNCNLKVLEHGEGISSVIRYEAEINAPLICKEIVLNEQDFTDIIRTEQEEHIKDRGPSEIELGNSISTSKMGTQKECMEALKRDLLAYDAASLILGICICGYDEDVFVVQGIWNTFLTKNL
ncbi:galactosylceramide sulfotransferase-like [Hetaerina americana]|uniref:galactosylceramide sulfotransferase-like n=1 Tax=Hetaerina americana TaxID=62018 RepID=UPI003A7F276A